MHSIHWTAALMGLTVHNNNVNKTPRYNAILDTEQPKKNMILNERTLGYNIKQAPCFTRILRNCMIKNMRVIWNASSPTYKQVVGNKRYGPKRLLQTKTILGSKFYPSPFECTTPTFNCPQH